MNWDPFGTESLLGSDVKETKPVEQKASVGRIVHYVLDSGPHKGEHRPAFIVLVWTSDLVNLQVFPDSQRDGTSNDCLPVPLWVTSRKYDETGDVPGTWHWPERV